MVPKKTAAAAHVVGCAVATTVQVVVFCGFTLLVLVQAALAGLAVLIWGQPAALRTVESARAAFFSRAAAGGGDAAAADDSAWLEAASGAGAGSQAPRHIFNEPHKGVCRRARVWVGGHRASSTTRGATPGLVLRCCSMRERTQNT
jgi:hypothetical protein